MLLKARNGTRIHSTDARARRCAASSSFVRRFSAARSLAQMFSLNAPPHLMQRALGRDALEARAALLAGVRGLVLGRVEVAHRGRLKHIERLNERLLLEFGRHRARGVGRARPAVVQHALARRVTDDHVPVLDLAAAAAVAAAAARGQQWWC